MGAGSNAASKSDLTSLKNTVSSLQKKVTALETTTVDDKAIQGIVKNIDYLKLKDNIRMDDLSTEILKNPGAIADSVAQSFTKDTGKMETISKGLADNEKFAKTLADTLTDTSGKYRSGLRGEKGETGELSTSKDAVKAALYDKKYTMWCGDGDYCKLPVGSKGIQIGNWYAENAGNDLYFHQGERGKYSAAMTPDGHLWTTSVLHLPNGWTINGDSDYLRFFKDNDVKGALQNNGIFWGKAYGGDIHNWPNFVRTDRQYYVRSNRGGLLIDKGGWSENKGDWETMKFEQK